MVQGVRTEFSSPNLAIVSNTPTLQVVVLAAHRRVTSEIITGYYIFPHTANRLNYIDVEIQENDLGTPDSTLSCPRATTGGIDSTELV